MPTIITPEPYEHDYDIANYIVNRYPDTTMRHLQTIMYFLKFAAYQEHYTGLIEESFYAFEKGPTIPELYNILRNYEDTPLKQLKPVGSIVESNRKHEAYKTVQFVPSESHLKDVGELLATKVTSF